MTHNQPLRQFRQLRLLAVITTARRLFDALNTTQCLSTAGREQRRMLNLSHLTVRRLIYLLIIQEKDIMQFDS